MTEPATAPLSFRLGDRGDEVVEIRERLVQIGLLTTPPSDSLEYDGEVERAVRTFQQQRGLTADGRVDSATYRTLDEACWRLGDRVLVHRPGDLLAGDDVFALQRRLLDLGFKVGRVDGRFGPATEQAVREFQRNVGIPPDGTCGPATLKALARLAPIVRGGRPNAMRAEERIRDAGPRLTGKTVVIDPASSPATDPALRELAQRVTTDLARRVEGRLAVIGVSAYLSSPSADATVEEAERARFANRAGADLCLSLLVDADDSPEVSGVASYYFGVAAHGVSSSVGERFAGLVQREIVARTDLTDLRSHARSWDLLRMTRMPAVRVDVGYITNAADATRLADPAFRDVIAEGVVAAVQRLYLPADHDPHTGVLRLDEIKAFQDAPDEHAGR